MRLSARFQYIRHQIRQLARQYSRVSVLFRPNIRRFAMHMRTQRRRIERRHASCDQRSDDAGEHIARARSCQRGIAGLVFVNLLRIRDDRTMAFK